MRNNTAVIIPSYNTKHSIVRAVYGIINTLPNAKIIIVDDNSPDGSANLIKETFKKNKNIQLIIRKHKGGRGSAVLRGFQEALGEGNIEYLVEMDGDLCHNPKYIPLLIEKCRNYDVAIASKYLKTSKINGLSTKRRIFSQLVNLYIRFVLKVPITDYTNGFRCYKRKVLKGINLMSFKSKGFIVLSEIAYRIHKKGFTFGEIPFNFTFKEANKSNFNWNEIKEAFLTVLKLRISVG